MVQYSKIIGNFYLYEAGILHWEILELILEILQELEAIMNL